MRIIPEMPAGGFFVVAVSGGVDSMVLLDLLARRSQEQPAPRLLLIVAHYDHGMRDDSISDRIFVQKMAKTYGLPFVYDEGKLGKDSSEAKARDARYKFLQATANAAGADGIITAHHQDDMLETAVINIIRGTGRRGLTSLKSSEALVRPLLHVSKATILTYAKEKKIIWHEDSTNLETKYLRNYVRLKIMPKFSENDRIKFQGHIDTLGKLNSDIDRALTNHLHIHPAANALDRQWFGMLPESVAGELLVSWLKLHGVTNIDQKGIKKLIRESKTLGTGKKISIDKNKFLVIEKDKLALLIHER